MASQIGTSYNLNKQYNFYCTDLTVDKLKNFSYGLPNNAIIISSPTDNKSYDIGTPSILMTDYNSNIMPLTYTLDKSQFSVDEKTNKIKFKESIIDVKFTTYYNLLKQIENNVNVKHEAVSYFYNGIYDYYNDISTYYDSIADYYDIISYYYDEIVEMYDDIKDDIKEIEDNFYSEIDIIKSDINNQISSINNTLNKHTTYINGFITDISNLKDLYARVEALEQKINNGTSSDTDNDSEGGVVLPDVSGGNSGTMNTISPDAWGGNQTTDPTTGNTSPVRPSTPFG